MREVTVSNTSEGWTRGKNCCIKYKQLIRPAVSNTSLSDVFQVGPWDVATSNGLAMLVGDER